MPKTAEQLRPLAVDVDALHVDRDNAAVSIELIIHCDGGRRNDRRAFGRVSRAARGARLSAGDRAAPCGGANAAHV